MNIHTRRRLGWLAIAVLLFFPLTMPEFPNAPDEDEAADLVVFHGAPTSLIDFAMARALSPTVANLEASFFDFEQLTVDNTAAGVKLTAAKVVSSLVYVQCRVRTAEISFLTVDPTKTTVTASVGQLAEPGDVIRITSREEALNLRMIRTGATSGQADCSYKSTAATE